MSVTIGGIGADRSAWLAERRSGIGASETPIVLGLTGSRLRLYLAKTGQIGPDEPSEAMAWGLRLEDDIVDAYQERTGRRIAATQRFHAHPYLPYMIATLDGITECGRVVEFKSAGPYGPGADLGGEGESATLPDSWVVQVNQQLAIAGALGVADPDRADVAVFGPGLRLRVFPAYRSEALIEMAADAIRRFMEDHVIPGIPPEDLIPEDAEHVARAYRRETGEVLSLGDDVAAAAARYHELGRLIRDMEAERDAEKARILMALGNAAGADLPGYKIRRKVIDVKERTVAAYQQVRLTVKPTELPLFSGVSD